MSEKLKLTDAEISHLIIERDTCQFKAQRIDELLNKIGEQQGFSDAEKKEPSPLPGSDFSALPWKSYATKTDAKPDEAGWIFANTKGAEALLATVKVQSKAPIGDFEYSFSGPEHQFISRKPLKK